jgi:lysyl-tRNA synthetase class II
MPELPDAFAHLKQLTDVGVKGTISRTERGELSVLVNEDPILSKSLLPTRSKQLKQPSKLLASAVVMTSHPSAKS